MTIVERLIICNSRIVTIVNSILIAFMHKKLTLSKHSKAMLYGFTAHRALG